MGAPHRTSNAFPKGLAPFVRENSGLAANVFMYLFMVSVTMWSFALDFPGPLLVLRTHMVTSILNTVCWLIGNDEKDTEAKDYLAYFSG